jgi:hypothetical protein
MLYASAIPGRDRGVGGATKKREIRERFPDAE